LKRKDFLYLTGMGLGASMLSQIPVLGSPVKHGGILQGADVALKKKWPMWL